MFFNRTFPATFFPATYFHYFAVPAGIFPVLFLNKDINQIKPPGQNKLKPNLTQPDLTQSNLTQPNLT